MPFVPTDEALPAAVPSVLLNTAVLVRSFANVSEVLPDGFTSPASTSPSAEKPVWPAGGHHSTDLICGYWDRKSNWNALAPL